MTHLHVSWSGRFTNERHHVRHWLDQLAPNKHVDKLYDDHFGVRKVDWLTNVLGTYFIMICVRMFLIFNLLCDPVTQQDVNSKMKR